MKRNFVLFSLLIVLTAFFIAAGNSIAQNPPPIKVALIFDIGGRGDGGFNDSAYNGLEKAVVQLGVKAIYKEFKRPLELDRVLKDTAASDAGLIIGVGFAFSDKFNKLAAKYPAKKFVCIDYNPRYDTKGRIVPLPENLYGLTFKEEEGSYLVGALAALTSKSGKIGFIGGMDCPNIRKFQAGYLAGAVAVRPDIKIVSKYAGITGRAFNDQMKGYQIATGMYEDGADIIYHAAGTTGAGLFEAAKKIKRLAIGVDIDQNSQAPGFVLTSMVKNVDEVVLESVRAYVRGYFSGGLKTFGLKKNGVGFIYNDQNKKLIDINTYNKVMALQAKIIAGELTVPTESSHKSTLSQKDFEEVLSQLQGEIYAVLTNLDHSLQKSAEMLAGKDLKGESARNLLKGLYGAHNYLIDCETVSNKGIMMAVEPPRHRSSEGADISRQAHMIKLFKYKKPVLSGSFNSVEGHAAVALHHPIFSPNHVFAGSVSALFAPEYLLAGIIGPVSTNLPIDIFLMQKDGRVIYDADPKQIGLNVFTDPLYKPFPDLRTLARKVAATPEGSGDYRFYQKGIGKPTMEKAYWRTISLPGTQWRLVITCAKENIEK